MSKSFTPGLKVLKDYTIKKKRILPVKGKVHVRLDTFVNLDEIVASTFIPGNIKMINIAIKLNVEPSYITKCMKVEVGEKVNENQVIAESKGLFGFFKSEVLSPVEGEISQISKITGQIVISEKPEPIEVDAYISGNIKNLYKEEGVEIESTGTYVQGILGIGGEKKGKLKVIKNSLDNVIKASDITSEYKGCILLIGSFLTHRIYKKAEEIGVIGIITGGFGYNSLSKILGYSLGVAITGTESGMTLIITEGFGKINMSKKTYNILSENHNEIISINGSTQIRAGVLRPEIFIFNENKNIKEILFDENKLILAKGSKVRIIREPNFGKIGTIIDLPFELEKIDSETVSRVAKVLFEDGTAKIVPRTNLEVILSD